MNIAKTPTPIRKQVKLIIYYLAIGYLCENMNDLYECSESIIYKYIVIVCTFLSSHDMDLFSTYIHIPIGNSCHNIIDKFRNAIGLPNIYRSKYGIHILLSQSPRNHIILHSLLWISSMRRNSTTSCCK